MKIILKFFRTLLVLVFLSILLSLGIYGVREWLSNKDNNEIEETPVIANISDEESFQKGITLTPKSFVPSDFLVYLQKADEIGSIISWTGSYNDLLVEGGGPEVLMKLSETRENKPVIIFSVFSTANGVTYLPPIADVASAEGEVTEQIETQPDQNQIVHDELMNFVQLYKPEYLALGNEINLLYESSPEKYAQFVTIFNSYYDEVKVISPDTQIFVTFQLERIKGLRGGLFGGENNPDTNSYFLLQDFAKADFFAFTTYPGLIYQSPQDIPDEYYTSVTSTIATSTPKNIIYSEVGWTTGSSLAGWESSEQEQLEFIDRFWTLNEGVSPKFVIWSFMYDQNVAQPYNEMGLIKSDGSEKLGWARFLEK